MGCPICGSNTPPQFAFCKWGIDILECKVCGSAAAIRPKDFNPEELYGEEYYQGGRRDGYADYGASERVIRREARRALNQLRSAGVTSGSLLEVGCGYGFFLKEAAPSFNAVGIEVSEAALSRCGAAGLAAFPSMEHKDVQASAPFRAIVMLDSIEHLEDPFDTLSAAVDLSAPGAAILISTGDWGSILARCTRSRWRLMTPPQHLYFFTRAGIERLLARVGFSVVSFERPWRFLSAGLAAYKLSRPFGLNVTIPRSLHAVALPLNGFDVMRVVAQRLPTSALLDLKI